MNLRPDPTLTPAVLAPTTPAHAMTLLSALRILLLGLAGILLGSAASATPLEAVYEGFLVPESFDAPIPITVEVRELHGVLVGHIKTGPPQAGSAPIASGENESGHCTLRAPINAGNVLRLTGTCHPRLFEGNYAITSTRKDTNSAGTFRLMPKANKAKPGEEGGVRRPSTPLTTLTECINANTRCLIGCPKGDYNTEFLCANRCRQRHLACKGKASASLLPPAPVRNAQPEAEER